MPIVKTIAQCDTVERRGFLPLYEPNRWHHTHFRREEHIMICHVITDWRTLAEGAPN